MASSIAFYEVGLLVALLSMTLWDDAMQSWNYDWGWEGRDVGMVECTVSAGRFDVHSGGVPSMVVTLKDVQ